MALKDGDIITLDYEGRTEGVLFDTTLEKVAKKEDSIVENRVYALLVAVDSFVFVRPPASAVEAINDATASVQKRTMLCILIPFITHSLKLIFTF